jgi:hypothetical protein
MIFPPNALREWAGKKKALTGSPFRVETFTALRWVGKGPELQFSSVELKLCMKG